MHDIYAFFDEEWSFEQQMEFFIVLQNEDDVGILRLSEMKCILGLLWKAIQEAKKSYFLDLWSRYMNEYKRKWEIRQLFR